VELAEQAALGLLPAGPAVTLAGRLRHHATLAAAALRGAGRVVPVAVNGIEQRIAERPRLEPAPGGVRVVMSTPGEAPAEWFVPGREAS
jgi:hypothetical protein